MSNPAPRPVVVRQTPIELAQFIKFAGLAATGGDAKNAIVDGHVLVNGEVETRKGKKLVEGDEVTIKNETIVVALGRR